MVPTLQHLLQSSLKVGLVRVQPENSQSREPDEVETFISEHGIIPYGDRSTCEVLSMYRDLRTSRISFCAVPVQPLCIFKSVKKEESIAFSYGHALS